MIIIGITGTLGAGKGTIVDYLVQHMGFRHFSVRAFLAKEVKERNLPLNRDSLRTVANELRACHSPSYIAEALYAEAAKTGDNCVIESIRTPGEVEALKKRGSFFLFAVDAKPELRYQRIIQRDSETDQVSFQTFLENEKLEMQSDDPNKQNIQACINQANFIFKNDGNKDDLYKQLKQVLQQIKNTPKH
ncbi:MAG: AAA family ATPase [Bacteroidales bacterium]